MPQTTISPPCNNAHVDHAGGVVVDCGFDVASHLVSSTAAADEWKGPHDTKCACLTPEDSKHPATGQNGRQHQAVWTVKKQNQPLCAPFNSVTPKQRDRLPLHNNPSRKQSQTPQGNSIFLFGPGRHHPVASIPVALQQFRRDRDRRWTNFKIPRREQACSGPPRL